jgi:hypothetical protein
LRLNFSAYTQHIYTLTHAGTRMSDLSIAHASRYLEELLSVLDDAYWEASSMDRKDLIYGIISVLHQEHGELAKLSIQDHHMTYQPVTENFKDLTIKLKVLRRQIDELVLRPKTAAALEPLITKVTSMIVA